MAVIGVVAAATIVEVISLSWGERRSVTNSPESLVEVALFSSAGLASLALGLWAGVITARETSRKWAGWAVGVTAAFLASFAQMTLFEMALSVEAIRISADE